jgi:exopolysaccharide production protein ExoZ
MDAAALMENGAIPIGRLTWLQAMRFAAALLVVLHHSMALFMQLPFNMGLYGVLLFFTISGYVITGLLNTDPRKYLAHRFLRIYPAFFGSVVLAALLLGAMHVVPIAEMRHLKWSMTLLPVGGPLSLWTRIPYWTLLYEIVFYAVVFVFICVGSRFFNLFLVLWAVLIVARNIALPGYQPMSAHLITILTSHLTMCFIMGAALARLHHTGASWPGALVLVAAFTPEIWVGKDVACLGVLFTALIHATILLERHMAAPKALTWLGDRSYGTYLMHNPGLTFALAFPIGNFPIWAVIVIISAAGLLIGIAYGHIEFSFYLWAKRKFDRRWADRQRVQPTVEAASPSRVAIPN